MTDQGVYEGAIPAVTIPPLVLRWSYSPYQFCARTSLLMSRFSQFINRAERLSTAVFRQTVNESDSDIATANRSLGIETHFALFMLDI